MGWLTRLTGGGLSDHQRRLALVFDRAWEREKKRFGVVTGLGEVQMDLVHPTTGAAMAPHEGLGGTFEVWCAAEVPYSQRKVLFDFLAEMLEQALEPWQQANYLTAVRRPNDAVKCLKAAELETDASAEVAFAYAWANVALGKYERALNAARKAVRMSKDHIKRTLRADTLHLNGRHDEAHRIYDKLTAKLKSVRSGEVETMFEEIFSIETGAAPSPQLAIDIGTQLADDGQRARFWELGELEFYWSPHFTQQHAYELLEAGDMPRALGKLLGLVQEMPWLREPTLNALAILEELEDGSEIMPELQTEMRRRVKRKGWTTADMHKVAIETRQ